MPSWVADDRIARQACAARNLADRQLFPQRYTSDYVPKPHVNHSIAPHGVVRWGKGRMAQFSVEIFR